MEKQNLVQSVATANELLHALSRSSDGSSLSELSRELDMTPSRVLRHLMTLVDLGLVERAGSDPVYRLGVELVRLGERAQRQHDVARLAYPGLRRLADKFGDAAYMARRLGSRAVVWLSLEGEGSPHLTMAPGMWTSLSGSAIGRVFLAFDPDAELDEPLKSKPTEGYPDPLPTRAALEERLARIRERYFEKHGIGEANAIYSLAAPVFNYREVAVAVIAVAGFSVFFPRHGEALLAGLLDTAKDLSSRLGSERTWPEIRADSLAAP